MMRDDAFAQWLGEKHRCYDLLQAGICVISADDQEEVLFANQSVLEMYECSSWDEFHELVHGTWTGMSADDFAGLDHIGPDQSLHLQMHFTGKKGKQPLCLCRDQPAACRNRQLLSAADVVSAGGCFSA